MKLFILICTIPERAGKLRRLTGDLDKQIARHPEAAYKIHDAGRAMPTGTKRNQLIEQTESDYFCFIDDDDFVMPNYLDNIMHALVGQPDVVTFRGWMTTNGMHRREFTIKLGSKYEERNRHYYRFPNHLAVMRRDKVQHIKFPPIYMGEDFAWAKTIHDKRLLRTEVHINAEIYHYQFITNKPGYAPAGIR